MDPGEREYLEARLNDAVRRCRSKSVPAYVGFLDEAGAAAAERIGRAGRVRYELYGGYDGAERLYFGAFPDWCGPEKGSFPISRLKITNKSRTVFGHRDVLGAIMSLGLERDAVGDIIIGEKESFVFVGEAVSGFIASQLEKIASCGVEVTPDGESAMPLSGRFSEGSETVASLRIDCVTAALGGLSRAAAAEAVAAGMVSVNGTEALKPSLCVENGDVVSIRKHGKFIIDGTDGRTKKGRVVLKYRKYV